MGDDPVKTNPQFGFVADKILITKYFVHICIYVCWKSRAFRYLLIC